MQAMEMMTYSKKNNIAARSNKSKLKPKKTLLLVSVLLVGLTSCTQLSEHAASSVNKQAVSNKSAHSRNIDIWPSLNLPNVDNLEIEKKVTALRENMTLEQKVAQMIQPEIRDFTVEDMRRYGFGSFLNGGGAFPQNNKHATPQDWIKLAEEMYQASVDSSLDGSSIPAIWGTDAVHGHNNVIGATLFPHNIGLGAANNPDLIKDIAQATAREVMVTGIDWVFAPTVAVVRNDRWGRTYEGYSEDPAIVKEYSKAIVTGLQGTVGKDFLSDDHVISTVKHFLGDGGTQSGIDQGNNISDEQTLFDIHAQGYVGGLTAGAQTVMASFNSWHGEKMHGHKYLLTDVLKNKMGFDGLVVGDWLGHGQIPGCTNYNCPATINAGLDIYMASGDSWKPLMENTIAQVKSGVIPQSRIDDAVSRILRVKLRSGLFDKPSPANRPLSGKVDVIGSQEHRSIARRAVRESLVLLKNKNKVLPINPSKNILIAGDAANNIGKQSGGWTITWQGTNNKNEDFPGGYSIYDGFADAVSKAGGKISLSLDGEFESKPDVAIVVFGEEPYAEGVGDTKNVAYQQGIKSDLGLLEKLKAQGIPVVSVFISGRPLYVNAELNASDAFVAAWLPGSEGNGVSDVLLSDKNGNIAYDFTGRLSYSWPASPTQTTVNFDDADYSPLLPYGYGLSYNDKLNKIHKSLDDQLAVEELEADFSGNLVLFQKSLAESLKFQVSNSQQSKVMSSNVISVDGVTARTIDKDVQEDARQVVFQGNDSSLFSVVSNSVIDLSEQKVANHSLFINVRLDSPVNAPVALSMACEKGCQNSIDMTTEFKKLATKEWQELNISLACFEKSGAKLDDIISPLQISSSGPLTLSLSEAAIRFTPNVDQCE